MNTYIRSLGILVSSFFFLQTQALWAQEAVAPRSTITTAIAAEPQAAGQIVSSPLQVVPALPVPRLIKFSGMAKDASGQPRHGVVGITFSIYAEQQGGATLWMETQNIELDAHGRYAVLLGSTQSAGMPLDLFATGEPRWLGARVELPGEVEQPRVLLVSVPYALKASDADTVGGIPASAFVLAPTGSGASAAASASSSAKSKTTKSEVKPQFTSSGTVNYLPLFTDSSGDLGNSNIYQSATGNYVINAPSGGNVLNSSNFSDQDMIVALTPPGASDKHAYFGPGTNTNLTLGVGGVEKMRINSAGNVGIGYSNPQQRLVIGAPAGGAVLNATNLADQDLQVVLSAPGASSKYTYFGPSVATNLTLGVGLTEMMRITNSGNVGIGTKTPAAMLEVNGTAKFDGLVSFASGQTFPGAATLGANTFTGNQTVNGNLSATGVVTGSSFQIGSNLFAFGSYANQNAFLGFAGNATMTGTANTASGYNALYSNTTGYSNTASGNWALYFNTTGHNNTASGLQALYSNTTGFNNTASGLGALSSNTTGSNNTASGLSALNSNTTGDWNTASGLGALLYNTTGGSNTAVGYLAGPDQNSPNLTNSTAIGANSVVSESNALVLGCTSGVNSCPAAVNVGIGTTAPQYTLDVNGTGNFTGLVKFASGQTFPGTGTITGVTAGTGLTGGGASGTVTLSVPSSGITNAMLQNSSLTVTAGTDLTGGGAVPLGGSVTLNLDTTKVPLLAATNFFTAEQSIYNSLYVIPDSTSMFSSSSGDGGWGYGSDFGVGGSNGDGISSPAGTGVVGQGTNYGVYGTATSGSGYAGYFYGNVQITGSISKGSGSFKIDHPLDPANKYLYHSFVESPDMMNIYNGNVILDGDGTAWITLPDYFEALNRDFRYQLTAIGAPGPNLYIAQEISNNRFQIAGGTPGGKVSWQVTGIRQDAYAKAHPIIPEVEKTGDERGRYLHPVEHGMPKSLGLDESRRVTVSARHQLQERPELQKHAALPEALQLKPAVTQQHIAVPK